MATYRQVKRAVMVLLLGALCFVFGYIYFGSRLAGFLSRSKPAAADSASGPPAPVMRELESLRRRIAANPRDEEAYAELGNLFFEADKFDQAEAFYERAVRLNGRDTAARNDLALCYHIAGREKEAFAQLREALRISPNAQHLWLTLGLVDYETGRVARAKEALQKAYRINPVSEAGRQAQSMILAIVKKRSRS